MRNNCRRLLAALVACLLLVSGVLPAMAEEALEGVEVYVEPTQEYSVEAVEGFAGDPEILAELVDNPVIEEEIELDLLTPEMQEPAAGLEEGAEADLGVMAGENECTHENTYTSWDYDTKYTEIPGDNRYHHYESNEYRVTYCYDCGEEVSRELEDSWSYDYYSHSYDASGVCEDCGHVNTCKHEDTYNSYSWNEGSTYTPVDLKYHTVSGTKTVYVYCNECYQLLSKTENVPDTKQETHSWDQETGKCRYCGLQNTCTHPNAEQESGFSGSASERQYQDTGSDNTHIATGTGYTEMYCNDCGLWYNYQENVPITREESHYYWDKDDNRTNVCLYCQHECKHTDASENTRWEADETQKKTYVALDDRYHNVTAVGTEYNYCYNCYNRFNLVPNVTRTEKHWHNYNDQGVCADCGHVCAHSFSNYYSWSWDETPGKSTYTYIDGEYHNRTGFATSYRKCNDCGQRFEVQNDVPRSQSERHTFDANGVCTKCANGCPHANTDDGWYWEDAPTAHTYVAKDEVYHITTGVATVYTRCNECGLTISETKGVARSEKEEHDFVNGVCSLCSYACAHAKFREDYDYEDAEPTYKPYDLETHERIAKVTTYNVCVYCGQRFNEVKGVDRVTTDYHAYNDKGVCTECGFDSTACAHAHTYAYYSWNGDVKRTYAPVDDTGHVATGKATEYVYCYDCDVLVKKTENVDYSSVESHDFNESGVCKDCGYTCTHSRVEYRARQENGRYEDTGDAYYHNRTYDVTKAAYCKYCDKLIGEKQVIATKTVPEAHEYGSGICANCRHACPHANVDVSTLIDDKQRDTFEAIDDQYHYRRQETRVETYCTDCDMNVSVVPGAPKLEKEYHRYAENGVCKDCEHVCAHSDYSDEYEFKSSRYEARDDESHTYIKTIVNYKKCQYCNLKFDVSAPVEEVSVYGHDYDENGYCDDCNYACTHSKLLTESTMINPRSEDAGSDDYHNEIGEVIETSRCAYCSYESAPVSKGEQVRHESHSYYVYHYDDDGDYWYGDNQNVCAECGHVLGTNCDHSIIRTSYSIFGKKTYTPVDERFHLKTGRAYAYDYCDKCDMQVAKRVVESYSEEVEHNYDDNGVCEDCGYTRTCPHLHVREVINWDNSKKLTYTDVNDDYHTVTGPRYTSRYCLDCGTTLDKVSRGVETVKQMHNYNHKVCSDCGHKQACAHAKTREYNGYDDLAVFTALDAKYHTVTGRAVTYTECADCGETLSKVYGDTVTRQETHDFDDNGVCQECHFVNTCAHEHTFDEFYWQSAGYREIVGDNNSHEIIGYKVGYIYCTDCHQRLETWKQRVSLGTAEHEYNKIGVCYQCGHERACNHPFTYEGYSWDYDSTPTYTYVNANTHKATVHQYKRIICAECEAVISETDLGEVTVNFIHDVVNGVCVDCHHAVKACAHKKTHKVTVWGGNSEYTYKNAKTHDVEGIKYIRTICDSCYATLKTEKVGQSSGTEGHSYNRAGRCVCGARSNVTYFSADTPAYMAKGETYKLTMTAYDRSDKKASLKYTFASSNKKIVSVSSKGKLTAKKTGTVTITITANNGLKYQTKLTVKKLASKFSLSAKKKTLTLKTEGKDRFVLTGKYDSKAKTYATITSFTSSNKKVAKVNKYGVVTAVGAGKCVITAKTSNGKKATCTVTVKDPNAPKSVKIKEGKKKTLKKGKSLQLHAVRTPSTSTKTITWTTSNKKVATVTKAGKVKAVGKGTAVITATAVGGKKATIKITVK